jgi:phage baseplate assembly protein W
MIRRRQIVEVEDSTVLPNVAIGIKLPIVRKDGRLFSQSYSTEDQISTNLKNLVLTRKGERLYQPSFGTSIYDLLFENIRPDLQVLLRDTLLSDINFWFPNLMDVDINVEIDIDRQSVFVSINYRLNANGVLRTITFNLNAEQ